jgi:hypothetical protein
MQSEQSQSAQGPYTLGKLIIEIYENPDAFNGSHDIREASRKADANLIDVESKIAATTEDIERVIHEGGSAEELNILKKRLLGAQVVQFALRPHQP